MNNVPDAAVDMTAARDTSMNAQISSAVIRLLSEYTGRGPTKARTTISGRLVACLLEDTLTKGERALVAHGRVEAVLEMRYQYQQAMSDELTAAVSQITGRQVVAFMSSNHASPDYAIEAFVLDGEPEHTGAPSDQI
jgi:uncharacterized protein YbcI